MVISIEMEKTFDKIQHPFITKTLKKTRKRKELPQRDKIIYQNPTVNIRLNGERLDLFPLRSGTR